MFTYSRVTSRRALIIPAVAAAALLQLLVVGTPSAHADPVTLTVVGTSDVSDSGLIQNLTPLFQAAYPQYALKYIGEGTGAAITDAENGNGAALIVHAASLENQFVSSNYSLNNEYGRAIFWGDYILAGATADPAGIGTAGDGNNIVRSFADIAKAGIATHAVFVSRGGTPGTTIQEHAIWARLASISADVPTGLTMCTLSAANGGGMSPSTTSGDCPTDITYPSWYVATGDKQAANINQANVCPYGPNDCYVFTDRGTYENVQNGTATGISPASNLSYITQNDTASTEDPTKTLLINSFHAYAVNPDATASDSATNPVGATDFLNYLTSPDGQAAVAKYEVNTDTGLPAFRPDARPTVTVDNFPASIPGGSTYTLTGSIENVVPGTPALSGVKVTLMGQVNATPSAAPVAVATATTGSDGAFSMNFTAPVERTYTLTTPLLTAQVENASLNPIFADQLQATSTALGSPEVPGVFSNVVATGRATAIAVTGRVAPKVRGDAAVLQLYAKIAGPGHSYHFIAGRKLTDGQKTFGFVFPQKARSYQYYLRYVNTGYLEPGQSDVGSVTVG